MIDRVNLSKIFECVKVSTLSRGDKFFLNKKEYTFQKTKFRRIPRVGMTFIIVAHEVDHPKKERWFTVDHTVTTYINRRDK